MKDIQFRIAEAARMTGVSPSTLRLWETQGLVEPLRTPSGQRLYDRALIARLKAIAWLRQEKGLNPAAIRESLPEALPDEDATGEMDDTLSVGARLRRLRRNAGETLETVAQATGLAVSLLSTFERTSQGVSLQGLHALASHFGTTVATLSGQEAGSLSESLIRAGEWPAWPPSTSGVTVQMLARGPRQMECNRFVLSPGASSEGAYQHAGEEFIHVLTGSLEVVLDGDRFFELHAGDSFYFESRRPHSWRNRHDGETALIWINTPPTF